MVALVRVPVAHVWGAQLVAERRFDWRRSTHRRALLENELSAEAPARMVELAGA
jgi:hypothetical protein